MANNQDLFFSEDDDPSDEGLDDLQVGRSSLAGAVVYNTDWTVETITRQVEKGAIDLSPNFQRRDAWTLPKKSLLIESILLNFPVPPLTLAEKGGSKTFIVVDGKQRLMTLSQYFGLMEKSKYNNFRLSGLIELNDLNGCDLSELKSRFPSHYTALENYSVRTNVIRGWIKDDVLYSIFLRLNSGSVKLSPQELRQALNPGSFSDWLAEYTAQSDALRSIFPGTEPDFRMRDLELMIRYIGFQFYLNNYRGDLKRFLDGVARALNQDWLGSVEAVQNRAHMFEVAYKAVVGVFGPEHAFRKWNGDKWESRLNRAVFDLMLFYLRDQDTIDKFVALGDDAVTEFKSICSTERVFRDSIESTTKSIDAVVSRLGYWGSFLQSRGVIAEIVHLSPEGLLKFDA